MSSSPVFRIVFAVVISSAIAVMIFFSLIAGIGIMKGGFQVWQIALALGMIFFIISIITFALLFVHRSYRATISSAQEAINEDLGSLINAGRLHFNEAVPTWLEGDIANQRVQVLYRHKGMHGSMAYRYRGVSLIGYKVEVTDLTPEEAAFVKDQWEDLTQEYGGGIRMSRQWLHWHNIFKKRPDNIIEALTVLAQVVQKVR